ncbi:hypothetical protein [Bacillus sp. ms-22]
MTKTVSIDTTIRICIHSSPPNKKNSQIVQQSSCAAARRETECQS